MWRQGPYGKRPAPYSESDLYVEEENGDQHLFATDNLARAIAAYRDFEERFGRVRANKGLADAKSNAVEFR